MDINDYNQRLEGVISDLKGGEHGRLMVMLGHNALAKVRQRIQQKGKDSEGKDWMPYSKKSMLSGSKNMTTEAFNKIGGSKKRRRELKWVTVENRGKKVRLFRLEEGYKQFRELHGAQTNYVDFTFSGRMWLNTSVTSESNNVVVVKPQNDTELKKMEGNVKLRGKILALTKEERDEVLSLYDQGILNIYRKNGIKSD
jgi:hypothetical protein